MKDITDITILLDASSSMGKIAPETISGFNKFISDQKKVPGEAVVTLYQFNGVSTCLYKTKPLQSVPSLEYHPNGNTALLDTLGRAIDDAGQRLSLMDEAVRPDKVVFVVITDGEENASYSYGPEKIKCMVSHQSKVYKWQFVFLGANIDSFSVAGSLGICGANTMNFAQNSAGTSAFYGSMSSNFTKFRTSTKKDMSFEAEDYKAQNDAGV